ncbi:MAG: hypothetical protein ACHQ5A_13860, partial [Opitutales bacterium]
IASPTAATFSGGGTLSATEVNGYTATATATGNYTGANSALVWNITPAGQTVSLTPDFATTTSGSAITFVASGGSGTGAWVWGGTSGALGATAANSIALAVPGSYTVTVRKAGDANHSPSNLALSTLTVTNTPPTSSLSSSAASLVLGRSVTLTATVTDPDANLASQAVDVSVDNLTWTSGWANWSGATAWNISGAADSRTITFLPPSVGTWYFRAHGTDSASASSNIATVTVTVTEPAAASIKVVPQGAGVIVQDTDKTKHTQIHTP